MMWQRARSFSIETAHFTSLPSISLSYPVIYFQLYSNYCWLKRIHIPMLLLLQMGYIMVYISISMRYSHDIPTKTWLDVTILNFKYPTFPSFCKWFFLGNFIFYQISVAFLQWPWQCRPGDEASKPSPGRPRCRRRFGARDRRERRERRERTERRERRERKRKRKRAIRVLRGRASNWWSKLYKLYIILYI